MQIELGNDTVFEGPEQFMAQLSTVEVVVTLIPENTTILIQDDDGEWMNILVEGTMYRDYCIY